jgi:hypothetical protein
MDYQVDIEKLLETTEQILILRGGPTSGNWGHSGRPGKKGGSGSGGGFGRIGIKDGKKAGRKGIKRASRQTRAKRERGKGAGVPATGKAIPASVLGRARGDVAKAKKTRDRDLKKAHVASREIEKSRAAATKAQQTFSKSLDKVMAANKKSNDATDMSNKKANEIFDILNSGQNILDPKVKSKIDRLQKQSDVLIKKDKKAKADFQAISKQHDINRQKDTEATRKHEATLDKHKNVKKPKDIIKSFEGETETASKILFQNNLNEAKAARSTIKRQNEATTGEIKALEKRIATLDTQITDTRRFLETSQGNVPSKNIFSDRLFKLSQEAFDIQDEIRSKRKSTSENARQLIKVDTPTVIRQAPGSQRDKVNSASLKNRRKDGQAAFQDLVSDDVLPKGSLVKYQNTDSGRAFQRSGAVSEVHMSAFAGPDTVVHELGHTAENYNPRLLRRSIEFRDRRTAGEDYQPLADLTGNQGYRKEEKAKPDRFIHPYMGKDYGESASEIFSMGIEEMFRDPVGFAEKDPEMFDFIYAQARTP